MLRFSLSSLSHFDTAQWRWTERGRWESGDDWIEPIVHPALESVLMRDGRRLAVIVRERSARTVPRYPWRRQHQTVSLSAASYDAILNEVTDWHLDSLRLAFSPEVGVTLTAGAHGVAPVYLQVRDGRLVGSWNLDELAAESSVDDLVPYMLARTLCSFQRYSTTTHYRNIVQVTERATARFTDGQLHLTYPNDALHAHPRELRRGADVVGGLSALLDTLVQDRVLNPATTALTLSGGMDSANVALSLGTMHPHAVTTSAMIVDGASGEQQVRRRRELASIASLGSDVTVAAMDHPPLAPSTLPDMGLHPDEEGFVGAIGAMVDQLAERGIEVSFGGVGGDEMLALGPDERPFSGEIDELTPPDWLTKSALDDLHAAESDMAPAAVVNEVTLQGRACYNPIYIRRGIWPVEPLAHPDAIRFGEWLPASWRRRKRVFRERLRRHGASAELVNPSLPEGLGGVMNRGVYRHAVPMLRRYLVDDLILAQLDVVDVDRLSVAVEKAAAGAEDDVDYRLHYTAATEMRLRRLAGLPA